MNPASSISSLHQNSATCVIHVGRTVGVGSVTSHASPIPLPSESSWSAFDVSGQLSIESFTPSPSESDRGEVSDVWIASL